MASGVYDTGTITLTNGSATVTGSGTSWVGNISAGNVLITNEGAVYPVEEVVSATEITLSRAFTGSGGSGVDYEIVPTGGVAQALSTRINTLISSFQAVVDEAGQGKFSDGSESQPGIRFTADEDTGIRRTGSNSGALVAGGIDVFPFEAKGGGSMIQSDPYDTTSGRLMPVEAFGLGGYSSAPSDSDMDNADVNGFWTHGSTFDNTFANATGIVLTAARSTSRMWQIGGTDSPSDVRAFFRNRGSGGWSGWLEFWHEGNTTVDGSGFILEASPIVRVYTDSISEPVKPVGATLTHSETGVYVLSGVPPLATEGWQVRAPDGMDVGEPTWVDGSLHVHIYDQRGRPADVPDGAFAMLRFWEADDEDDEAPVVTSQTEAEAAAARLMERRSRATLTRGEFLLAALGAGSITEADAETAASGAWPAGFDAFLTGLSSAERIAAKSMWTDSRKIRRDSPLLAQIAAAQGLDDAALDALFGIS